MIKLKDKLTKLSPVSAALVLLFAAVMTYIISLSLAASGTATLYTSPSGNQTIVKNNNFTVSVRIATAANVPVTGAEVQMTFPTDKLQVVSVGYSGSPYNIQLEEANSGGVLKMVRAAFPMIVGGDKLFAQVTFKAIGSGTASIGFNANSKVTSGEDDSNILAARNGVSYNITNPASPTPSPSPTPAPAPSTGGGSSSSPPSSNVPSSPQSPAATTSSGAGSSPQTAAPSPAGQPTASTNAINETSKARYKVDILAIDHDKKALEGAAVSLYKQNKLSDKEGIAHFTDVPVGNHKLTVEYKGKKIEKNIQIVPLADASKPQFFTAEVNTSMINPMIVFLPPILVGLGAAIYFARPRLVQLFAGHTKVSTGIITGNTPLDKPSSLPPNYSKVAPGSTFAPTNPDETPLSPHTIIGKH